VFHCCARPEHLLNLLCIAARAQRGAAADAEELHGLAPIGGCQVLGDWGGPKGRRRAVDAWCTDRGGDLHRQAAFAAEDCLRRQFVSATRAPATYWRAAFFAEFRALRVAMSTRQVLHAQVSTIDCSVSSSNAAARSFSRFMC